MYNELLRLMPPPPYFVEYEEPPFRIEDYYYEISVFTWFVLFLIILKIIDDNKKINNN